MHPEGCIQRVEYRALKGMTMWSARGLLYLSKEEWINPCPGSKFLSKGNYIKSGGIKASARALKLECPGVEIGKIRGKNQTKYHIVNPPVQSFSGKAPFKLNLIKACFKFMLLLLLLLSYILRALLLMQLQAGKKFF